MPINLKIKESAIVNKILLFFFIFFNFVLSQQVEIDTLYLKAGSRIEFDNSVKYIHKDTMITIPTDSSYLILHPAGSKTDNFYKKLDTYSKKNKILKLLHNAIFVEEKGKKKIAHDRNFNRSFKEYSRYSGKIIRHIRIKQVRLISGSVHDTTNLIDHESKHFLEKLHFNTKKRVIAKYLTFETGEELNPRRISDSERLLRGLSFLEDVKLMVIPNKNDSTGVDVVIVTKDRFHWAFNVVPYSLNRVATTIYDRNVAGNGWNFELKYIYNGNLPQVNAVDTKLDFLNINGWFVDGGVNYYYNNDNEGIKLYLSKPFVTVETKYGGGLEFENFHFFANTPDNLFFPFTYNYDDLWVARQFPVSRKNRNKTFITAGRIGRKEFTDRPYIAPDSNSYYYSNRLALGSLIYTNIDYFKSRLIYGFGTTEDIPVGDRVDFTAGVLYNDFTNYNYIGLSAGHAFVHKKLGYVLSAFKWGALFRQIKARHEWLYLYGYYISPLLHTGKFDFRHFVRISYAQGFNQLKDYYLHLNGENSIRGLNLNPIEGIKRLFISYENVIFTPMNIFGFKTAMFAFADLGFISNNIKLITPENLYSGIGLGVRIKNENLVFSAIQIRLAYYPRTAAGSEQLGFNVKTKATRLFENIFPVKPTLLDLR